jgi:hypothetical protein
MPWRFAAPVRKSRVPAPSVVERWRQIGDYLADAQTAARIAANTALPESARRDATRRQAVAVAALLEELGALRREGVLATISEFLEDRYRR